MKIHSDTDMETLVNIVIGLQHEHVHRKYDARLLILRNLEDMNGAGWSSLPVHTRRGLIKIIAGNLATVPMEAAHA